MHLAGQSFRWAMLSHLDAWGLKQSQAYVCLPSTLGRGRKGKRLPPNALVVQDTATARKESSRLLPPTSLRP